MPQPAPAPPPWIPRSLARDGWPARSPSRLCAWVLVAAGALLVLAPSAGAATLRPAVQDGAAALEDLDGFQERVAAVLALGRPATVGVRRPGASGSGVLVSADGLVLTAAHVVGEPGLDCRVLLADGRDLRARSLGTNLLRDAALVRVLEEVEDLPFVDVPPPAPLDEGAWCVALGHPGGFDAGRGAVPRLGRVLDPGGLYLWTDSALIGGDSGGPLFALDGRLIGIHSRIEADVANNYHVPLSTFRLGWTRLLAGESWSGASARLGVVEVRDARLGARLVTLRDGRPAERAGLLPGDVVTRLAGEHVRDADHLRWFLADLSPGDTVRLDVRRGDAVTSFDVLLGGREERR